MVGVKEGLGALFMEVLSIQKVSFYYYNITSGVKISAYECGNARSMPKCSNGNVTLLIQT